MGWTHSYHSMLDPDLAINVEYVNRLESHVCLHDVGNMLHIALSNENLKRLYVAIQRQLTEIDNATEALCSCTDPARPEGEGCRVHTEVRE